LRERRRFHARKNMQCEGMLTVLGIRRRDGVLPQLEAGAGHVLERVFRFRTFGFLRRIALSSRVDALCKQLSGLNGFLPGGRRGGWFERT
jgi:hypothetical protein